MSKFDNKINNLAVKLSNEDNIQEWTDILEIYSFKSDRLINIFNEKLELNIKPVYNSFNWVTSHKEPVKDNIYIIRVWGNIDNMIKIGYSSNIEFRIGQYKMVNPYAEVINTYYIENGIEFEHEFHKQYVPEYRREWYKGEELDFFMSELKKQSLKNDPVLNDNIVNKELVYPLIDSGLVGINLDMLDEIKNRLYYI